MSCRLKIVTYGVVSPRLGSSVSLMNSDDSSCAVTALMRPLRLFALPPFAALHVSPSPEY